VLNTLFDRHSLLLFSMQEGRVQQRIVGPSSVWHFPTTTHHDSLECTGQGGHDAPAMAGAGMKKKSGK
jgi:hypothetical protein